MNEDQNLGYCGLNCNECISYKATIENDTRKLSEIAKEWGKHDDKEYSMSDIQCHGCTSDTLNIHCNVCETRTCGQMKRLNHCGECKEFVCDTLRSEWDKWVNADWKSAKRNLMNAK